jgi:hypothetical protein
MTPVAGAFVSKTVYVPVVLSTLYTLGLFGAMGVETAFGTLLFVNTEKLVPVPDACCTEPNGMVPMATM